MISNHSMIALSLQILEQLANVQDEEIRDNTCSSCNSRRAGLGLLAAAFRRWCSKQNMDTDHNLCGTCARALVDSQEGTVH